MKFRNLVFMAGALIAFSSCGENSTSETTTKDTVAGASNTASTPAPSPVNVPEATKTHFESKYSNASNVTWSNYNEPVSTIEWEWTAWPVLDANDYVVSYDWNGMDYYAWYDQDGNWIGSSGTMADISGLPTAVSNTVKKEFSGYTVTSVDKENDKDREAYEVKMEKGDDKMKALISSDGTVLKKKGKVDGEKVKEKTEVK